MGDVKKAYALEVNCEQKKLRELPNLNPLLGLPMLELDLKLNQLRDLPPDTFKGLKFKTLHKEVLPVLDVSSASGEKKTKNKRLESRRFLCRDY